MIVLIGGASHTGKTNLAQKLLEKYKVPYLSLDHLKMGLIRGSRLDGISATDHDEDIAEALWPVVEGIIRTNIENKQHIIIEGCYLPHKQVKMLKEEFPSIINELYICFTESYIVRNFESHILRNRDIIEKRFYDEERTTADFIKEHNRMLKACQENDLGYIEITGNYGDSIQKAITYFDDNVLW